jgi:biopolymer transport protein ExbB/TolQ
MTEASMGTAFLLVSAIAAFCGYQFRNRRSKQLMWFAAFLLFVPGLA